ncbi:bifunctional pyr operon transcriptional regulator/uracil phosphoribosyltransferase PyrR [Thiorhodococcus mannitoliphagus]|uniref:Bifunctional pyr operon transcriptional regulator/uracil phosphoribosyltransferase PyrR n=1 Tax=Thiorhodococcus mannitoliphagus TaxID=329406 RepID=A0A6P1E1B6_9GAMM|nr:bifunctional pyr operon transcriptional regulator/uracil phosphoribosyltransferase PyrR [Thiorhodococcus mannitoliphagus]
MSKTETWKDPEQIAEAVTQMARDLRELLEKRGLPNPLMIGIHTGGVWIADRLHEQLGLEEPLGHLDISFYRDDFTRIGLHPQVRPSYLPVGIDDRHLILVDDVLQSGRTIRAALNVLFDYGRPASVILATLAERSGRELPIAPDVVGFHAKLESNEQIKLSGPHPLIMLRGRIPKRSATQAPQQSADNGSRD